MSDPGLCFIDKKKHLRADSRSKIEQKTQTSPTIPQIWYFSFHLGLQSLRLPRSRRPLSGHRSYYNEKLDKHMRWYNHDGMKYEMNWCNAGFVTKLIFDMNKLTDWLMVGLWSSSWKLGFTKVFHGLRDARLAGTTSSNHHQDNDDYKVLINTYQARHIM